VITTFLSFGLDKNRNKNIPFNIINENYKKKNDESIGKVNELSPAIPFQEEP